MCFSILISHYSRGEKAPYNVLHLLGDLRAWFTDTWDFTLKMVMWIQSSPRCKSIPLATALFSYLSTFDGSSSSQEQLHWVLASVCSTKFSYLYIKCICTLSQNSIRALHHCFVCQNIPFFFFFLTNLLNLASCLTAPGLSCSMWSLVPWPGIETRPPCIGSLES